LSDKHFEHTIKLLQDEIIELRSIIESRESEIKDMVKEIKRLESRKNRLYVWSVDIKCECDQVLRIYVAAAGLNFYADVCRKSLKKQLEADGIFVKEETYIEVPPELEEDMLDLLDIQIPDSLGPDFDEL